MMAESRNIAVQNAVNRYLECLHTAYAGSFASVSAVFEELWLALEAAKDISFENLEDQNKYFETYLKNLAIHIEHFCDITEVRKETITASIMTTFKSIVTLYQVLLRYGHLADHARDVDLASFVSHITHLRRSCDAVEYELQSVDQDACKRTLATFSRFTALIANALNEKKFTSIAIEANSDKNNADFIVDFILLENALSLLPSISQLNEHIDLFLENHKKDQLLADEKRLQEAAATLVKMALRLRSCTKTLNDLLEIEDKIKSDLDNLLHFDAIIAAYKNAIIYAGLDSDSIKANGRYSELTNQFRIVSSNCNASAPIIKPLKEAESHLQSLFAAGAGAYLEHARDIDLLANRMRMVKEQLAAADHQRTALIARVAQADGVMKLALEKLSAAMNTLHDHTETTLAYASSRLFSHLPELCVGGGAGSGISTVIGYAALSQPHFMLMAGLGLLIGSSVGMGVGLIRESFSPEKKSQTINKVSLTSAVNLPASKPKSTGHWYSKWSLTNKTGHGDSPPDSDIMKKRN